MSFNNLIPVLQKSILGVRIFGDGHKYPSPKPAACQNALAQILKKLKCKHLEAYVAGHHSFGTGYCPSCDKEVFLDEIFRNWLSEFRELQKTLLMEIQNVQAEKISNWYPPYPYEYPNYLDFGINPYIGLQQSGSPALED